MNQKKYFHPFLLLFLVLSLTLASCATPSSPGATLQPEQPPVELTEPPAEPIAEPTETAVPVEEPVTIEWWTVPSEEYSEEAQRKMVEAFEATHPHIKVNITVLPESGFTEKMTAALGSGQGAPVNSRS